MSTPAGSNPRSDVPEPDERPQKTRPAATSNTVHSATWATTSDRRIQDARAVVTLRDWPPWRSASAGSPRTASRPGSSPKITPVATAIPSDSAQHCRVDGDAPNRESRLQRDEPRTPPAAARTPTAPPAADSRNALGQELPEQPATPPPSATGGPAPAGDPRPETPATLPRWRRRSTASRRPRRKEAIRFPPLAAASKSR